jgi:hypothetical protein
MTLRKVSIGPPGLTLDKGDSNEGVRGINVRRVPKRRGGKGCSEIYRASVVTLGGIAERNCKIYPLQKL